ncbi:MAG TPA: PEP-CTERM sorting domain-containing protein [Steroidobacter sp.]|uniref:PEP-CTERM sorting domain-containing protein n=1 Tax=Steroidobacter sp. TaxID=1978227 RepID=UPI002EDB6FD9
MKVTSMGLGASALALMAFCFTTAVGAVPVLCKEASANHVAMDAAEIRACLAADLTDIAEGIFSVDTHLNQLTIAVQPVGGEKLDHWFVYFLNPLLSSGDWRFVKLTDRDGRLSHIKLFGVSPPKTVPEPGTLALLGIALMGVGLARRRKRS